MAQFAAAMLEASEEDIVFENGKIGVKGAPAKAARRSPRSRDMHMCQCLAAGMEPGLSDEAFFEPANNTYPSAHISMLEVDRETGEPKLLKLVAVDDAGNLINPLIVEGQIHGGLAQGIGQAMIEEAVYNEDGQLMTGSFMDYAMPRATDSLRAVRHRHADAVQSVRRQGRWRSRDAGSTPCIVSAAVDALSPLGVKHIDMMLRPEKLPRLIDPRIRVIGGQGRPRMIPVAFDYQRAASIDDAIGKLAASGGGKLIAGGHSLVPLMKLRLRAPGTLVDISKIPGLAGIKEAGGRIEIGANTTHHDIASSKLLRDKCPMIAEAASEIGDPQVRNRGTIGGSIAHADPAADLPAVVLALDADIVLKGPKGSRTVKASVFFRGFYDVDLAPVS